ncbi:hypothetical protein CUT44_14185 [Streptomyces carminius]|uniref:Uncharacterized protein n=1 Tax=Streptomyces carminius TaxID=2665496 RepID=A0A2M8LYT3_9ACTN|nr:hypothetical protein CUT44_14185 [Streptomyces carminius]
MPIATLHRWQSNGQRQLAAFLTHGAKTDLPPLMWTLAQTGALTGEADGLEYTPEGQRAAVTQWAAHVGAIVTSRTTSDGREELYAGWKIGKGMEEVGGCFRATIFLDDEAPQPGNR